MRLKHVKGAKEKIEASSYLILKPNEYKGQYNKLFDNDNPLHIEIGMGKGSFIIGMALKYPDINFIGIEKYDSVIVKAVDRLEGINIPNLKLIRFDATEIENVFDHEVDTIYLNFSDPWPKNRHEDRRLSSGVFLRRYDSLFKDDNTIIMKTDNRKLFEFSIMSFNNYGYKIEDISLDLHNDDLKDNVETEYETKFVKLGNPIYKIKVNKQK